MPLDPTRWMRLAIETARQGLAAGQSPFGCVIVRGEELVSAAHNRVVSTPDPTAHAEIVALREAADKLQVFELGDCQIYSTCEPCPMCASAIHWSKIPVLFFGASIQDAAAAGFSEIALSAESVLGRAKPEVAIHSGLLRDECVALFTEWLANPNRIVY